MEQLNRVTVRGTVGNIRTTQVGDRKVARLSVATNYAYRAVDGTCVIETTWHLAVCWEGEKNHPLDDIAKGDIVQIEGRLRNRCFTSEDGREHTRTEILASRLEKVVQDGPAGPEM